MKHIQQLCESPVNDISSATTSIIVFNHGIMKELTFLIISIPR